MMRRFISRLLGQTEDREIAPRQGDLSPQNADPDAEVAPDDTAAIDLPDPATLDSHSNYRPFLRETVPAELKRIALRRAWTSDPAIASFKGFADYDWDANAVDYGWLRPADAVLAAATVLGQAERRPDEEGAVVAELKTLDEADGLSKDPLPGGSAAQTGDVEIADERSKT